MIAFDNGARPLRAVLERRFNAARLKTRYYTPGIHVGAFELPPFIADLAAKGAKPARTKDR